MTDRNLQSFGIFLAIYHLYFWSPSYLPLYFHTIVKQLDPFPAWTRTFSIRVKCRLIIYLISVSPVNYDEIRKFMTFCDHIDNLSRMNSRGQQILIQSPNSNLQTSIGNDLFCDGYRIEGKEMHSFHGIVSIFPRQHTLQLVNKYDNEVIRSGSSCVCKYSRPNSKQQVNLFINSLV